VGNGYEVLLFPNFDFSFKQSSSSFRSGKNFLHQQKISTHNLKPQQQQQKKKKTVAEKLHFHKTFKSTSLSCSKKIKNIQSQGQ